METWQIIIGVVIVILLVISSIKVYKYGEEKSIWTLIFIVSLGALLFILYTFMSETQLENLIKVESSMY